MALIIDKYCNNKACKLQDACSRFKLIQKGHNGESEPKERALFYLNHSIEYDENSSNNFEYFRPKVYFDEQGDPKFYCKGLIPHNYQYLILQSKINLDQIPEIRKKRKISKIFDIVKKYGSNENRVALMKDLKDLNYI